MAQPLQPVKQNRLLIALAQELQPQREMLVKQSKQQIKFLGLLRAEVVLQTLH